MRWEAFAGRRESVSRTKEWNCRRISRFCLTTTTYYFFFSLTTITTTTTTSVSQLFPADESRPIDVSGNQIMENTRSLAGPWTRTQSVNACPGACGKLFFLIHFQDFQMSEGQNACQDGKKECPKSIPMADKGGSKAIWTMPINALFIFLKTTNSHSVQHFALAFLVRRWSPCA